MAPAVARVGKNRRLPEGRVGVARRVSGRGQGKGAPSEKHLCPVGVQASGGFSSGASPSHFPVSHHPSSEKRACNYPFSTWVSDSQLISEPRLHLTSAAAPQPCPPGMNHPAAATALPCALPHGGSGFCPSSLIRDSEADFE